MIERDERISTDEQREAVITVSLQLLAKAGVHATVESPNGSTLVVKIRRPWAKKGRKRKAEEVRVYGAE